MPLMKILKWLLISVAALVVLFIAAMFFAICGPRPPVVAGTDRPEWLPEQATDIVHRSQEGFGWWRVAEFTISEADFRAYAAKHGCEVVEVKDFSKASILQQLRTEGVILSKDDSRPISQALVFERRASNNGGITVGLDASTQRAYFMESHR